MNEDKITTFIIDIKEKLSSISTKVDGIRDQLANHERRLTRIEQSDGQSSLKDKMLEFSLKAMIGLIAIVGALTGAGGILSKFFAN